MNRRRMRSRPDPVELDKVDRLPPYEWPAACHPAPQSVRVVCVWSALVEPALVTRSGPSPLQIQGADYYSPIEKKLINVGSDILECAEGIWCLNRGSDPLVD